MVTNILILFSTAANLFLAGLVYRCNRHALKNISFSLLSLSFAFWTLSFFFYFNPLVLDSLFWIKAIYLSLVFLIFFMIHFSYAFPDNEHPKRWFLLVYPSVSLLIIYLLFATNLFVEAVYLELNGPETKLGIAYPFISIFWALCALLTLFNLIKKYLPSKGIERMQFLYIFYGLALYAGGATILDGVIPVVFGTTKYFSLSAVFSLFFVGLTTYAIVRHKLLDIRFVVARSVAYLLLVIILGTFYTGGLFLASTLIIKQEASTSNLIVSAILALFIAFTFQPLKTLLEKITDNIFFRGRYDVQKLLSELGSITNNYIDLGTLSRMILETLTKEMRIGGGVFVICGEDGHSIYSITDVGFTQHFYISFAETSYFFPYSETVVFDDLEEGSIKNLMRSKNLALVKTLKVKDKIIGLLMLGEKASGEVYSSQDLTLLDIFSPEVAVAIQNSQSYDKIKRFNVILSQEVQKATADLRLANERLKSLDELKDDFVSIASHELRTPMTAIRSYAWMALHRSDMQLNEKMEKYLIRVLMSSERLINLVNDMLNISRIEAGKIEISPEPVDLTALCKDIFDEVYYSKGVEKKIAFNLAQKEVPKVFADPDKLRQVLLNLVGNSLKFTPTGGSISIDFFSDGKTVEISVKDTGVGIAKDDLGKLFQKFSRLDSTYVAAATSGGTGLGLYISKKIIELMHGKIWASSEGLGKGTVFTFNLPAATSEVLAHADMYTIKPTGEVKGLEPAVI